MTATDEKKSTNKRPRRSSAERAADRLSALEARIAKLKAEQQQAAATVSKAERAADTRRKILIGGALIAGARRDERHARALATLVNDIIKDNPKDAKPFDGWELPKPEKPAAAAKPEKPAALPLGGADAVAKP